MHTNPKSSVKITSSILKVIDGGNVLDGGVHHGDSILTGWKEIAGYLKRTPRTVQRWAREARMPVRHVLDRRRSPVIAIKHEIDEWLQSRNVGTVNHSSVIASSLRSDLEASMRLQQQLVQKMTQARRDLSSSRAVLQQTVRKIAKLRYT